MVGLRAIESFLKSNASPRFSLRVLLSPSEETGSIGFSKELEKYSKDSAFLLGLEPALDNGNYVSSRKGVRWYEIHVRGKEAHAGAHHEDGVNACFDLATKLEKMQNLTNYRRGTTVSIGHMEGGKAKFNIVCGEADASVDTRFADEPAARELFLKIDKILKTAVGKNSSGKEKTETAYTLPVDVPPLSESKIAKELLKKYVTLINQAEGRKIKGETTGGAADLNQMVRPNVLIADGMGAVGGGVHTDKEFLTVGSLQTRADALSGFLRVLDTELK